MYGEPDIVLSFIRYAYWVMSVEADVCNYCKFVFDMARFTYTSINYTTDTSMRSEVGRGASGGGPPATPASAPTR